MMRPQEIKQWPGWVVWIGQCTGACGNDLGRRDFILVLFAADFGGIAPDPQLPDNMIVIVNQKSRSHSYWTLGSYQSKRGDTEEVDCLSGQLYNEAAAQVAIKRR